MAITIEMLGQVKPTFLEWVLRQIGVCLEDVRSWHIIDNREIHVVLYSGIILHVVRKPLGGWRIAFREWQYFRVRKRHAKIQDKR